MKKNKNVISFNVCMIFAAIRPGTPPARKIGHFWGYLAWKGPTKGLSRVKTPIFDRFGGYQGGQDR